MNEMLGALYPPEPTPVAEPEKTEKEESSEETKPEVESNFPAKKTAAKFLASDEDPDFIAIGEK